MVNQLTHFINFKGKTAATSAVQQSSEAKSSNATNETQSTKQKCSSEVSRAYGTTGIKTSLTTDESKQKYNEVSSKLQPETRVALSNLLKSGILLNDNSNDGTSVLDNLHKIATEPRIKGLDSSSILTEAITAVSNPFTITQVFGDIPDSVQTAVFRHPELGVRSKDEMDIGEASNCCVAASIEYNMASKNPAEFVRMAAGLSSEDYSVTKNIKLSDIAENKDDAKWLLDTFKLPHNLSNDDDSLEVKIAPDRNSIIRARVQASYRDKGERSSLDVLFQSAFMNVGSQQSYNTLTDRREGVLNNSPAGLTDLEKNFTEEVVEGRLKQPVIYQAINEEGKVQERACDYQTMANQLLTALQQNDNIIIGYVDFDSEGRIINGHEITIIGAGEAPTGDLYFVCNDTCNKDDEPIYVLAETLLPKIHHAGLPKEAVEGQDMPTSFDGIPYYKEMLS